ncbi:dipeptide/oligopeptide/nickel ABC transporter ATP-binding protein [Pseudovibrio japonicus]|uniref:Dipeptide/oligopeptide/nickel ABC transporter ATP-binding protein n=1 Tax=Pseudovibrio japonicus TaxID=366534 RepID=A0ABQ3EPE9_9HYPH|nr:ABC transporter ATP-binding protein [Pseudovibrio japonicus]GHB44390.1 dipeptide/oligopeptide/nickel ABC transporter ATP-binding protein [Pseudovibrio japonicus]
MVATPLLQVENLTITNSAQSNERLVQGVSFNLASGQRLGLIGKSGCGKSLTCHAITGALRAPLIPSSGVIRFQGRDLLTMPLAERQKVRGTGVFCIFQSPGSALHPSLTIETQLLETTGAASLFGEVARHAVYQALDAVSLPKRCLHQYPDALSGGMKQRVMMAMALILKPTILIADEPTTGLDVITEFETLQALDVVQRETGSALLFVSHDLRIVRQTCTSVLVMDAGRLVETCDLNQPIVPSCHPATAEITGAMERLQL